MKIFSVLLVMFLVPTAKASTLECEVLGEDTPRVKLVASSTKKSELVGKSGVYEATVIFAERLDVRVIEMELVDTSNGRLATARANHKGTSGYTTIVASLEDSSGAKFAELLCSIE